MPTLVIPEGIMLFKILQLFKESIALDLQQIQTFQDIYAASGRIDKRFKNFKGGLNVNFNYSDFNNVINNNPTESINFNQRYSLILLLILGINPT